MTIVYIMLIPLPGSELLELHGADALGFAQSQFINDIKALPDRGWHWSGWLTAKGRLIAFFAVARVDDQRLLLWLPAGGAAALCERLQRFVFRSKLSLRVADDWIGVGVFGPIPGELEGQLSFDLPNDDEHGSRHLVLVPTAEVAALALDDADEASGERWRLADLRMGLPYIAAGAGNSEQFVPQWLSLERLRAFSLSKGCYPGQEIVARMHYLGQSKRAAYRLLGDGPHVPGAMTRVLDGNGNGVGDVVWAVSELTRWEALAVLTVDKADSVARVEGGGAARVQSLP